MAKQVLYGLPRWIPFYAISGGKFQNLIVNFDANGKVKDWSSSKQGLY